MSKTMKRFLEHHKQWQYDNQETFVVSDEWRRYGEARRKELVEKDELEGGTSFRINKRVRIHKYFRLAEKVIKQFRGLCANMDISSLEHTYVMGHRLIAFLSKAMPKHPDYLSASVANQRNRTFKDLVWINDLVDEIALKIDEEQLNRYIANDFTPEVPDDSSESSAEQISWSLEDLDAAPSAPAFHSNTTTDVEWEPFLGWSFDISTDSSPFEKQCSALCGDADTSTASTEVNSSREASDAEQEDPPTPDSSELSHTYLFPSSPPPPPPQPSTGETPDYDEYSDPSDEIEDDSYDDQYSISEEIRAARFLRKLSEEDVLYEEDSEAHDSWAQNEDEDYIDPLSLVESNSGSSLTCDPARIAFREIMNLATQTQTVMTPPPPPPKSSVFNTPSPKVCSPPQIIKFHNADCHRVRFLLPHDSDSWATFDFATVRQAL